MGQQSLFPIPPEGKTPVARPAAQERKPPLDDEPPLSAYAEESAPVEPTWNEEVRPPDDDEPPVADDAPDPWREATAVNPVARAPRLTDAFLREALNEPQFRAAIHDAGPLQILAGAGSGKTRVITYRIARLIERGTPPWRIIALTFTNKAAAEMKERTAALVGGGRVDLWVTTFHAACLRILRKDADRLGYPKDFTVYDTRDQGRLIKEVLAECGISEKEHPVRQVGAFISRFKNKLMTPEQAEKEVNVHRHRKNLLAFKRYQVKLAQARCMDFDDLLGKTVKLLTEHVDVRDYYRQRFKYLLIDEFQDTNAAQYQIIRLMLGPENNICVVGDDDQSIYQWRGANIANILNFEKDFPDATVVKLEQNYRSAGNILKAATQVVMANKDRKDKTLWTDNGAGEPIRLYTADDEMDEAAWVADTVGDLVKKEGVSLNEIAVFYRTNSQSRALEDTLRQEGFPYTVYGGLKFYERREVKDLLAYFRAALNLADFISFKRIVNTPPRGIGAVTVEKLEIFAQSSGLSLAAALDEVETVPGLNAGGRAKLAGFREILAHIRRLVADPTLTAAKALNEALTVTGYLAALAEDESSEARSRMENLEELVSAAEDYHQRTGDPTVAGFLDQAALVADADAVDESTGSIKLMTVHISKGLEFDAVFVTGLEDNLFPHARSKEDPSQMSEERRLMYVAMTRARKRLHLSHARARRVFGQFQNNLPSPFLKDLPADILLHEAPRYAPTAPAPAPTGPSSWAAKRAAAPAPAIPRKKPSARATEEGWKAGDLVRHPTFEVGKIMNIEGGGEKAKLTIYFPRFGEKKLVKKFAKLEPAG
jgi:DNA helicase-2/ATP-dependent DNA helicase PcrA